MTSLEKPDPIGPIPVTTNVRYRLPSVHPEGRKFVVIALAVAPGFGLFIPAEAGSPSLRSAPPSAHPDGRKFVVIALAVALVFVLFISDEVGFPLLGLALWVAAFFRD